MTPDDWQIWRQLRRAALADAPTAFSSTLARWSGDGDTEQRWRARLSEVAFNLVLWLDGDPVGMVSADDTSAHDEVELISLWVAPSGRGRGVGDEAIRQVLRWAGNRHPRRTLVLSVRTANVHAVRLYERHGFRDAGPSPHAHDERIMRM